MRAIPFKENRPSLAHVIVQWWRHWTATAANQLCEAARLGSDKLEYLTLDRETSKFELCAGGTARSDDLLRRRMLAHNLDPYEIALSDPALLRHLYRRCALCESQEACASDLFCASTGRARQGGYDWRDYCENALALELLIALQSRSTNPRYPFAYIP